MESKPKSTSLCGKCAQRAEMRCSKCLAVYYCSLECQREDWSDHKKICIKGRSSRRDDPLTGAPKTTNKVRQEIRDNNDMKRVAKLQVVMTSARMRQFFAGMDGNFIVRLRSTNQIVTGNNIPDCTKITVEWRNKRPCLTVSAADIELAKSCGMKGSDLPCDNNSDTYNDEGILFLSPASLAMELLCFHEKKVDPHFKFLEGGVLYLLGEPHYFWSLLIHLRATGKCFPPQPVGQATWSWRETWCAKEMMRMVVPLGKGSSMAAGTGAIHLASRSTAAICCADMKTDNLPPFWESVMCSGVGDAMLGSPVSTDGISRADDGTSHEDLMGPHKLPAWWRALEDLWGGVISRSWAEKKAPCMFFNTPLGCPAGAACSAHHCELFKNQVRRIKASGL